MDYVDYSDILYIVFRDELLSANVILNYIINSSDLKFLEQLRKGLKEIDLDHIISELTKQKIADNL